MKFQRRQLVAAMAGLMLGLSAGAASAMGGPSGAAVGMPAQGHIGEVIVNPYKIAPLTAIVRTGGKAVFSAAQVGKGDTLDIEVADGRIEGTVQYTETK
mgnify:CR=1 FL=1